MGEDSIVYPSDYYVRLTGSEDYKVTIFYYASEDPPLGRVSHQNRGIILELVA